MTNQVHDEIDEFFKKEIAQHSIINKLNEREPLIYERFSDGKPLGSS